LLFVVDLTRIEISKSIIMKNKKIAIIVAGGKGLRMQNEIPKQFIEVVGKPVLMHTLETFVRYDSAIELIVVLPESQIAFWNELCANHNFGISHHVVIGGETRFHSVKNGLQSIKGEGLVAVHDGVRPLVSRETITRCFETAAKFGSAIPTIDLVESLRFVEGERSQSVDRAAYRMVQTPQVFDVAVLKKGYNQIFSPLFTDDASVVEADGAVVQLVEGNRENIKITTPFDLQLAALLISNDKKKDGEDE
jgi:2-C-methyl-D-erythritol 4-phosphate cytidylyltransferase